MKSGIELIFTIIIIIGYLGCGAEVKKGSIRTIWELVLLGTLVNIGKVFIKQFLLKIHLNWIKFELM
jgi:hypothetical protein